MDDITTTIMDPALTKFYVACRSQSEIVAMYDEVDERVTKNL